MLFKTWSYFFSCLTHFEPDRKEYSTITKKNKKKKNVISRLYIVLSIWKLKWDLNTTWI